MTTATDNASSVGLLQVVLFAHPQGCRSYLILEPSSKEALVLDPHLDLVQGIRDAIGERDLKLRYVVDSHTHADHPSGAHALARRCPDADRVAHKASGHAGVTIHPQDGDSLKLGSAVLTVRHTPGHTPDHMALVSDGALFSGDSLLIGAVARTDFLGGDAGQLFDSIHALLAPLDDDTLLFPGHDYNHRTIGRVGDERAQNPWLQITDRNEFARALTANPPSRPANMDDLLRLNREGSEIPERVSVDTIKTAVSAGGARSVLDVRTDVELAEQRIPGATHIPLDQLRGRLDEVRAMPAPRWILCRSGKRAQAAQQLLQEDGIGGSSIITGGIMAYSAAGGRTVANPSVMSLERQVRVAAGLLAVLGVVFGAFVHPWFILLSGFVGAGLIFAGLTDRCGMALVLAKLPWNQGLTEESAAPISGGSCAATPPPSGGSCAATPPPQSR